MKGVLKLHVELEKRFKNQKELKVAQKIIKKGDDISWRRHAETMALLKPIDRKLEHVLQGHKPNDLKEKVSTSFPYFPVIINILDNWAKWNTGRTNKQAYSFLQSLSPKQALLLYCALCPA